MSPNSLQHLDKSINTDSTEIENCTLQQRDHLRQFQTESCNSFKVGTNLPAITKHQSKRLQCYNHTITIFTSTKFPYKDPFHFSSYAAAVEESMKTNHSSLPPNPHLIFRVKNNSIHFKQTCRSFICVTHFECIEFCNRHSCSNKQRHPSTLSSHTQ